MKIELGNFRNKFKDIYLIGSKPIQDWQKVVMVCFAIILGIFIWSYFFYFSVQSEFKTDLGVSTQVIPVKDKEGEIKEVIDKYKAREDLWLGSKQASTTISARSSTSAESTSALASTSTPVTVSNATSTPKVK